MTHGKRLSCPVCGATEHDLLLNLDCGNIDASPLYPTVRLMSCTKCGHAYNDLSQDEIAGLEKYYNVEYAPANLSSVVTGGDRPGSAGLLTQTRYAQLYQMLSPHIDTSHKILDVGCALGGFLQFLQERGFSALYGADVTAIYVEKARHSEKFIIERGSAEDLPFDDGSFDVLVLEQVLEHLVNPAAAFLEAGRVLKRGGILCIGVPDASKYPDSYFFDFYWLLLREHIQHFDVKSLGALAARGGFELLGYRQYGQPVMSEKMVMPNLCAVFRSTGIKGGACRGASAAEPLLPRTLKSYVGMESSRLAQKRKILSDLAESRAPVYGWGAGREFLYLYQTAGLKQCNLAGVIDLNPFKQNFETIDGMKLSPPEILSKASADSRLVITAMAHEDSILDALNVLGYAGQVLRLSC